MTKRLFRFGFEYPATRLANQRYKTDFEDSFGFWVEAESEQEALEVGQLVADRFCRHLYEKFGWKGEIPSWLECGYSNWIEKDPGVLALVEGAGWPTVRSSSYHVNDFSLWNETCP